MKRQMERVLEQPMVELLTLRADCSLVAPKPDHSSPYLPPGCAAPSGKLAEGSDKLASRIGFWAQDLDKKNFLRLGSLRERKFQGKKPKSFVHLLLEK